MLNTLQSSIALLSETHLKQLKQEWTTLNHLYNREQIHVVVLAPFNQGKSTLLSALFGDKYLPIDIVPTTGSAIYIHNGTKLETRVSLKNGKVFQEEGSSLLQKFALLDEHRQMREDVASMALSIPHPLLGGNVTFIDLPGTNDHFTQEEVVKREIFQADIVIQILNAKQLFTLEEENKLCDWVLASGIQHVLFVVNYCNLLETHQQEAILARAQLNFQNVATKLSKLSKLYRVDALPALRAQLKGNIDELKCSGIIEFAADLRILIDSIMSNRVYHRSIRLKKFSEKVLSSLKEQLKEKENQRQQRDYLAKEKLSKLCSKLDNCLKGLRIEFEEAKLYKDYNTNLATILRSNGFNNWMRDILQPVVATKLLSLNNIVEEICKVVEARNVRCSPVLPSVPLMSLPLAPSNNNQAYDASAGAGTGAILGATIGTAILPGVGTFLGAVVGGWFGKSVKEQAEEEARQEYSRILVEYENRVKTICEEASRNYIRQLSKLLQSDLDYIENSCHKLLDFKESSQIEENNLREHISRLNREISKY